MKSEEIKKYSNPEKVYELAKMMKLNYNRTKKMPIIIKI